MEHVKLNTSLGDIVLELDDAKAPISTANFLAYVDKGHYDQTIFHRVISNFMIQGGGFTADMKQKSTMDPISNEWKNGLKNSRGTIAMARTSDPNSATAQFFINVKDNDFLSEARDGVAGYAVFGRVTEGMDVVDKIRNVPTGTQRGMGDVPKTPVAIVKASRMSEGEVKNSA
jgi:peptidyl-prolyl cis-trans isomerase A (cyclophilin A)